MFSIWATATTFVKRAGQTTFQTTRKLIHDNRLIRRRNRRRYRGRGAGGLGDFALGARMTDIEECIKQCEAAGHDERLADGGLYLRAAALLKRAQLNRASILIETEQIIVGLLKREQRLMGSGPHDNETEGLRMVKQYSNWCFVSHGHDLEETVGGNWVTIADYQFLQAALREALGAWQSRCKLVDDGITDNVPIIDERIRITELRKQFLED